MPADRHADKFCDVAILGAGPAGVAAALALHRDAPQLSVVVLGGSAAGRGKVGETLPPGARSVLAPLGLWEPFLATASLAAYGTCAAWGRDEPEPNEFIFHPDGRGWHVDRRTFDALLVSETRRRGVELRDGAALRGAELTAAGWRLRLCHAGGVGEETRTARFVIDATGRAAVFATAAAAGARRIADDRLVALAVNFRPADDYISEGRSLLAGDPVTETPAAPEIACKQAPASVPAAFYEEWSRGAPAAPDAENAAGAPRLHSTPDSCGGSGHYAWPRPKAVEPDALIGLSGVPSQNNPTRTSGSTFDCRDAAAISRFTDTYTLVEACADGWWYSSLTPGGELVAAFFTDADIARAHGLKDIERWRAALAAAPRTSARIGNATPTGAPVLRAADSSILDRVAGANWLATGDAASTFDPLSSQGVVKALKQGALAAYAAIDHLAGDPVSLEKYEALLRREHRDFLMVKGDVYREEQRWANAPFWRRRHGRIWLRPDARLQSRSRPIGLSPLHLSAPDLERLWRDCAQPRRAHELVGAFVTEAKTVSDDRVIFALQHLIEAGALSEQSA